MNGGQSIGQTPIGGSLTFCTTTARYLRNHLQVVVKHFIKLLNDLSMHHHLPLELVELLQDCLHVDAHVVNILAMTITSHPDLVDLFVVGLEDSTDLLGNCHKVALQLISLWY